MPLFSLADFDHPPPRTKAGLRLSNYSRGGAFGARAPFTKKYDIFLSHSYEDEKLNKGRLRNIKMRLEESGYSVYVDWIVDGILDRKKVNATTAHTLKRRMNNSRCLLFATSETSAKSKWMPWELGYMDGKKGQVAIFPISTRPDAMDYMGVEYLEMYPFMDWGYDEDASFGVWVNNPVTKNYIPFAHWLSGLKP